MDFMGHGLIKKNIELKEWDNIVSFFLKTNFYISKITYI